MKNGKIILALLFILLLAVNSFAAPTLEEKITDSDLVVIAKLIPLGCDRANTNCFAECKIISTLKGKAPENPIRRIHYDYPDWKKEQGKVVVFIQYENRGDKKIYVVYKYDGREGILAYSESLKKEISMVLERKHHGE